MQTWQWVALGIIALVAVAALAWQYWPKRQPGKLTRESAIADLLRAYDYFAQEKNGAAMDTVRSLMHDVLPKAEPKG